MYIVQCRPYVNECCVNNSFCAKDRTNRMNYNVFLLSFKLLRMNVVSKKVFEKKLAQIR